jgi:hypothetical protein
VETRLLEWTIPERDYGVLGDLNPVLHREYDSTLLRVYIIPEKGYVVRRLDYCTPEGDEAKMAMRFESEHLEEVAEGIYFPRNFALIRNYHDFGNGEGFYTDQFTLLMVTNVNSPVPESAFEMTLPEGTRVGDHRPGVPVTRFRTGKTLSFTQVDDLIRKGAPDPREAAPRRPKVASPSVTAVELPGTDQSRSASNGVLMPVAISLNAVAAVVLIALLVRRRLKAGSKRE